MANKKGMSNFKHTPPALEQKQIPHEDFAGVFLNGLLKYTPDVQNKVMEFLNNHIAAARQDEYEKARIDEREAAANFEKYMANTQGIQEFIKARQATK
jgi:hypothetical protein